MSITLKVPKPIDLKPRITVIGVGGAGGNAVNNMIAAGLQGVDFVVANTDAQALVHSKAARRIQLGVNLTEGLGAGSRAEVGEEAAREAEEDLRACIGGSHMLFIAAGMGGGTGSGAAAVIGRIARDLGVLTVAVVTKPFTFEGTKRMRTAEAGIAELKKVVDTLIVIPNQNLFRMADERTTMADAFVMADQVLYSGIACIVDLIVKEGLINLDLADVRVVLSGMGPAVMGTGEAKGERRAMAAAKDAVTNQLLDNMSLAGAKGLLVSIIGGRSLTLFEVDEAATLVRDQVDPDANIIVGAAFDDSLGDAVRVSIVASGMPDAQVGQQPAPQGASAWPPLVAAARPAEPPAVIPVSSTAPHPGATAQASTRNAKSPPPLPPNAAAMAAPPPAVSRPETVVADDAWHNPGQVVIKERPLASPQLGTARGAEAAKATESVKSAPEGGFAPQAPAEVRRTPSKVPPIDAFPLIGQKEYLAKGGGAVESSAAPVEPRTAPSVEPRKGSLFKRLADAARGRSHPAGDGAGADPSDALPAFMDDRKRRG